MGWPHYLQRKVCFVRPFNFDEQVAHIIAAWFNFFLFFVVCMAFGFLLWLNSYRSEEHLVYLFDEKLPNIPFIQCWPYFWVSCCEVGLNGVLEMVFSLENEIMFVFWAYWNTRTTNINTIFWHILSLNFCKCGSNDKNIHRIKFSKCV